MDNNIDNATMANALASLSEHTDISDTLQAQRFLDLAIEKFSAAIAAAWDNNTSEQEEFVAAIASAEKHIESLLGRLVYLHLCAEKGLSMRKK